MYVPQAGGRQLEQVLSQKQLNSARKQDSAPGALAGPSESVVRAYAITPASAAVARAAGAIDVLELAPAAKPARGGQLSGTHLSFAVSGSVLAPEAVADAAQARLLLGSSQQAHACRRLQVLLPQAALKIASMPAPQVSMTLSLCGLGTALPSFSAAKARWLAFRAT